MLEFRLQTGAGICAVPKQTVVREVNDKGPADIGVTGTRGTDIRATGIGLGHRVRSLIFPL